MHTPAVRDTRVEAQAGAFLQRVVPATHMPRVVVERAHFVFDAYSAVIAPVIAVTRAYREAIDTRQGAQRLLCKQERGRREREHAFHEYGRCLAALDGFPESRPRRSKPGAPGCARVRRRVTPTDRRIDFTALPAPLNACGGPGIRERQDACRTDPRVEPRDETGWRAKAATSGKERRLSPPMN